MAVYFAKIAQPCLLALVVGAVPHQSIAASYITECAVVLDPAVFQGVRSVTARYALAQATRSATKFKADGSVDTWITAAGLPLPVGVKAALEHESEYSSTLNVNWRKDEYEAYFVREVLPFQAAAFSDCVRQNSIKAGAGVHLELWKDLPGEVLVKVVIHPDSINAKRNRFLRLETNGEFLSPIPLKYDAGGGEDFVRVRWPNMGRTLRIEAQMRTERGARGGPLGEPDALWIPPKIDETYEHEVHPPNAVEIKGGWNGGARVERRPVGEQLVVTAGANSILELDTLKEDKFMSGDKGKAPGLDDWGVGYYSKNPKRVSAYPWCAWRADEICTVTASFRVDRTTFVSPPDSGPPMDTMTSASEDTLLNRLRRSRHEYTPTLVVP